LVSIGAALLGAESIRIHVVDGRNGKTITKEHVQVWINGKSGNALSLVPGSDGIAGLDAPAGSRIEVEANYYIDCRPFHRDAPRPTYSVDEIKNEGVAAQNACGKLDSEAKPGELLFFVRPIHFWEGMKR
jgi:hypothetical protein